VESGAIIVFVALAALFVLADAAAVVFWRNGQAMPTCGSGSFTCATGVCGTSRQHWEGAPSLWLSSSCASQVPASRGEARSVALRSRCDNSIEGTA
jgi:hypothetical protein